MELPGFLLPERRHRDMAMNVVTVGKYERSLKKWTMEESRSRLRSKSI